MQNTLLVRLDQRDRALFARCLDHSRARRGWCAAWTILTHMGGTLVTISAALLPLLFAGGAIAEAARHALATLVLSHAGVQLVKRAVSRPRPARTAGWTALVREPDRFSFPSGHSCAAMAIAFSYATAFPMFALPLVALAALVGASRVFLGVHYPGDVVVGQLIAIGTSVALTL
jgi:undecaprenyl-diphosphatase